MAKRKALIMGNSKNLTDPLYDVFSLKELEELKLDKEKRMEECGKGESVRYMRLKKKLDRIDRAINRK